MAQQPYPCLWFNNEAKAAADFYCGIFKNAKIIGDSPMVVNFELNGQRFMGLNGGPNFQFNEAVSFVVECADQKEIDHYWNSLIAGSGSEGQCGWLKDKFGVSWQIVPSILGQLMSDPEKGQRVVQAVMKMKKFDIEALKNA